MACNIQYAGLRVIQSSVACSSKGGRRQGRSLKIRRTPRRGAAGRDGIATEKKLIGGFRGSPPLPPAGPSPGPQFFSSKIVEISDLKKSARELQNCVLFEPRGAPKIVKSVKKCRSRAPSEPFRKYRRTLSLFWRPKTSKTMLASARELYSRFRH